MSLNRCARVATTALLAVFVTGWFGTGCTPDAQPPKQPAAPPVIVPGGPGEPAKTVPADEAGKLAAASKPTGADISYMRQMITHHQQAIEMTDLVPGRVSAADVRGIAARIGESQQPEIKSMSGWLRRHNLPVPGEDGQPRHGGHGQHGGHGAHGEHGGSGAQPIQMTGMASEAQLAELRAAKGPAFDRLFLRLMSTHHAGAIRMAQDLLSLGSSDPLVEQAAKDVIATQTDEIGRMRTMLAG